MKHIKYFSGILLASLAMCVPAQAQFSSKSIVMPKTVSSPNLAEGNNVIHLSYCSQTPSSFGVGSSSAMDVEVCIRLPKELMAPYKGAKITSIRVALGGAVTNMKGWIRKNVSDKTNLAEQTLDKTAAGWNDMKLSQPYTITGDTIFMGYSCHLGAKNYYISAGGKDQKNSFLIYSNGKLDDFYGQGFGALQIDCTVEGDNLPASNGYIANVSSDQNVFQNGTPMNLTTSIKNIGLKDISNVSYSYQIDGGEAVAATEGACVAKVSDFGDLNFSYTLPSDLKSGDHKMTVNVTKIDGVDVSSPYNANSTFNFTSYKNGFKKKYLLLEQFTTERCPNCPYGDKVLDALVKKVSTPLAWAAHHAGYYTDEYTIDENSTYVSLFNIPGAPYAMVDRTEISGLSEKSESNTVGFGLGYTNADGGSDNINKYLKSYSGTPSMIDINLYSTYNPATRKLDVTVSGSKYEDLDYTTTSPKINIFLIENGKTGAQAGGNSNYPHDHIVRQVLTHDSNISGSVYGQDITFNGMDYTFSASTTLNSAWNADNMEIIAFISKPRGTAFTTNVLNTTMVKLGKNETGIEDNVVSKNVNLFVNNGKIYSDSEVSSLTVYNISGMQVRNESLSRGVYIARIVKDGKVSTTKIVVE